jgi:hypothetical protein
MSYPHRGDVRPPTQATAATTLPPPDADEPSSADRDFLLGLQYQALHYFLDNQTAGGLMLDRQRNHGPLRADGLCSVAATGMGFIALALASAPPYRLLSPLTAAGRIAAGLRAALERLPSDHGILPHFVEADNGAVVGADAFSTVETAWLVSGGLWAAAFLHDATLAGLAVRLYDRVDWRYWTAPDAPGGTGLLRHGKDAQGRFLGCSWDRLNGETAFMYVLAAGAADGVALDAASWDALRPFPGTAGGAQFHSADLGLFVFQYGLDLLDLDGWRAPGPVDLWAEAAVAVGANRSVCREAADRFATYRRYWGLSAGDGPAEGPDGFAYRAYSPSGPVDGTAHLTATLASVAHRPGDVLDNLHEADRDRRLTARGRYGFSTVNLDHHFVGRDMVGIDAGAAVLALDNYLASGRVRRVFHGLPPVARALDRLGFLPRRPSLRQAS